MHLPVLLAMPQMEVTWLMDADWEKAKILASSFNVPALPLNTEDLPASDIVLLAVPYGAREPFYQVLRKRQTALYVEKPFAASVEQHERYCSWFKHSRIAVGFQRRAWGAVKLLQKLLLSEPFGRLRTIRVEHGRPGQLTGSKYSANFQLAGGGMLFEVGIHWIDLALFVAGVSAVDLQQGRMIRQDGFDLHTEATFSVQTPSQKQATLELLISGLSETRNGLEFHFDSASVFFSQENGSIGLEKNGAKLEIGFTSRFHSCPSTPFQLCHSVWRALVESLQTGKPNWALAVESLMTTQLIEDLYRLKA